MGSSHSIASIVKIPNIRLGKNHTEEISLVKKSTT